MIVSERINIQRGNIDSTKLLDHIQDYFSSNISGEVLRFAIVGLSGDDLVVDASIRIDKPVTKTCPNRFRRGRNGRCTHD